MPRRERRKCSVCAKTGHNKRTCSELKKNIVVTKKEDNVPKDVITTDTQKIQKSTVRPPKNNNTEDSSVFVEVRKKTNHSLHVVDLKDTKREEILKNIEVFREKYRKTASSEVVNFASLIQQKKKNALRIEKKDAFQPKNIVLLKSKPTAVEMIEDKKRSKAFVPEQITYKKTETAITKKVVEQTGPSFFDKIKSKIPSVNLPSFEFPVLSFTFRPMAAVALFLIALIAVPFPAFGYINDVKRDSREIAAVSTEGFSALQASTLAAFNADMDGATDNLQAALGSFDAATKMLETKHVWLQSISSILPVIGNHVSGRQSMLTAGHHMALGNTYLVKGLQTVQNSPSSTVTQKLSVIQTHLHSATVQYDAALTAIASIPDSAIPKEYRAKAAEFELLFGAFVNDMYNVLDLIDVLQLILGEDGYKKYLVMFQNNQELRPTGGFMGSFAVVEVQRGNITWDIPGGGTYDLQGQLTLNYAPPLPLQLVGKKWELQDANWWSHIPASATVIEEMYENSRGSTVDGVFFVNATVLTNILDAIGPITDPETKKEITAESVLLHINEQKIIDGADENKPKKVLSDLLPQLMTSIESGSEKQLLRMLLSFTKSLNNRAIQLYAHDSDVQETLRTYGWTGEVREIEKTQDYLQVVRTNVQGQKTDANISESMLVETNFLANGNIQNTVTITREHTGSFVGDLYETQNINYMRIYVPEGSTLVGTSGFTFPPEDAFKVPSRFSEEHPLLGTLASPKIIDRSSGTQTYTEFNKTVFANWMIVPKGQSRTMQITYELPFTVEDLMSSLHESYIPYTMVHQKQSGMEADVMHTLTFDEKYNVYWKSNDAIQTGGNFALYKSKYERDLYYGIILKEKI